MGQAKRRGTFEQRREQALERAAQVAWQLEMERRLRYQQMAAAYEAMVWWQLDMSEQREARLSHRKFRSNMVMAQLMSTFCGLGLGSRR